MNSVDFNRLRVFYYVCTYGSIGKAAGELHITRSAVSQQIAKLEDELGTKLFLRSNRNVTPTVEAKDLCPLIEGFVKGIQEKKELIERGKHEPVGQLRIGAPIIFGETFVIGAVAKFTKKYPLVSFTLSFMNQPWLHAEKVLAGELDFAIIDLIEETGEQVPVATKRLIIEQQVLVGNKKLLGSLHNRQMSYDEIISLPFVVYLPGGKAEKLWCRKMFGKIPSKMTIIFSCQNLHAMIKGVKEGLGVGLIPKYLIKDELKTGKLIQIKTKKPDYENAIGLAQLPDRKPSLAEKTFIKMLEDDLKTRGKYL
jgi:DNA-binding transcriptional LysR family regulator